MVACLFHTAKITIRALRTLVLFCSNFNLYSSFASFFVADSDVFSRLPVGDSARSLRSRRNGARLRMRPKGRRWAAGENCRCRNLSIAAHLLPLFPSIRRTIPPVTTGTGGISSVQQQKIGASPSLRPYRFFTHLTERPVRFRLPW